MINLLKIPITIMTAFIYLTTYRPGINGNAINQLQPSSSRNIEPSESDASKYKQPSDIYWNDKSGNHEYYHDVGNSSKGITSEQNSDLAGKDELLSINSEKSEVEERVKSPHGRKKVNNNQQHIPSTSEENDLKKFGQQLGKNSRKRLTNQQVNEAIKVKPFDILKGSVSKRKEKYQHHPNHRQQTKKQLKRQQAVSSRKRLTQNSVRGGAMNENIVMEKKGYLKEDWCKTKRYNLEIKEPGCLVKNIKNNFCYGQCNSFYIPRNPVKSYPYTGNQQQQFDTKLNRTPDKDLAYNDDDDEDDDDEDEDSQDDSNAKSKDYFMSCASCVAQAMRWKEVVLNCPRKNPPYVVKRVRVVQKCKCVAVVVK